MNPLLIGLLLVLLSNEQDNACYMDNDMGNERKNRNGIGMIPKMEGTMKEQKFFDHESFSEALKQKNSDYSFLRPVPPPDILEKTECDCMLK